jgi:hypothetical protein
MVMDDDGLTRRNVRTLVRGAYDVQKLRIQMGNRIAGNFRAKLGQDAGKKLTELDSEAKELLADLRAGFKRLTDGVARFPRVDEFDGDEVISDYTELCLIAHYVGLEKAEKDHFKRLEAVVQESPIWGWLKEVRGIGPALAGMLISEIDIGRARYVSSLWKYAGLDVGPDGAGRCRQEKHLVKREYVDREGKTKERNSITFNPWLKTKLLGVLAASFVKQGEKSPYAVYYRDYKRRLESHAKYGMHRDGEADEEMGGKIYKGRRHDMAMRAMVKLFLADLYKAWRPLVGLPVLPPYSEAKLGYRHAGDQATRQRGNEATRQ